MLQCFAADFIVIDNAGTLLDVRRRFCKIFRKKNRLKPQSIGEFAQNSSRANFRRLRQHFVREHFHKTLKLHTRPSEQSRQKRIRRQSRKRNDDVIECRSVVSMLTRNIKRYHMKHWNIDAVVLLNFSETSFNFRLSAGSFAISKYSKRE